VASNDSFDAILEAVRWGHLTAHHNSQDNPGSIMRRILLCASGAALFGLIVLGAGCTFDEPVNPSWDVQVLIPLAEQRYNLIDLVDTTQTAESQSYGVNFLEGDSLLYFFYQDSIPYTTIGDSLNIVPQDDSVNTNLENAYFEAQINDSVHITLGEIAPWLIPFEGHPVTVDSFSFPEIARDFPPSDRMEYVDVDSGYLHLTIANNLPVPVGQLHLRIYHTNNVGYTVADTTLMDLPAGSVARDSINLQGVRLVQYMSVAVEGSSPGSTEPVLINTSDALAAQVMIGTLRVRAGHGYFPQQTVTTDTMLDIHSDHIIHTAQVRRGSIHFHSVNQAPMATVINIRIDNFTAPSGDPLNDVIALGPESQFDSSIALDGYSLTIPPPFIQQLHVVAVSDFDSTTNWVYFNSDQLTYSTYQTDTLYLVYADGILDTVSMGVGPETEQVESLPEDWDQLTIVSASARVTFDSDIDAPLHSDLYLIASRNGIRRDSVHIVETFVPNQDTTIMVEGLETLINRRPDEMILRGSIFTFGDVYLQDTNFLTGRVELDVPISFTLQPSTFRGLISTVHGSIDRPVQSADAEVTVNNHLPLSGRIVVLVAHDSTLFRTNPALTDTLFEVPVDAPVYENGRVQEPVLTTSVIALTTEQIDWFRTAPIYVRPIYFLDGTGGDTLSAYASDFIGFSSIGRFIYRIENE